MPCSWDWGINTLAVAAYGGAFWWAIRCTVRDAAASKRRPSAVNSRLYVARRIQLHNARGLRAAQLCAGILYAAVMSYVYLILSPGSLTSSHVFGLLLSYLHVATTCWCTTIALVPYFEKVLLEFNPVASVALVGSLALFINFSGSSGLAVQHSFFGKILAYDVLWLLEDCPLQVFLPTQLTAVLIHLSAHACSGAQLHVWSTLLAYAGLGVVLPVVVSGLLLPSTSHATLPSGLHTGLSAAVVGYLLMDQLLRAPPLVEPLQQAAAAATEAVLAAAAASGGGAAAAAAALGL
ncbi:hypothetical protein Agub_g9830, partial [Astrephomene gubernaculifera]